VVIGDQDADWMAQGCFRQKFIDRKQD
jgi:hypothetical protein